MLETIRGKSSYTEEGAYIIIWYMKVGSVGFDRQPIADHAQNLAANIKSNLQRSLEAIGVVSSLHRDVFLRQYSMEADVQALHRVSWFTMFSSAEGALLDFQEGCIKSTLLSKRVTLLVNLLACLHDTC